MSGVDPARESRTSQLTKSIVFRVGCMFLRRSAMQRPIFSENEWSPLRAVLIGRAGKSCFPSEPEHMIRATMPPEHHTEFRPKRTFPEEVVRRAEEELDGLADLLIREGVTVYRSEPVDWLAAGGYTGAMPRDGLLVVGNTAVEACFAWNCRKKEFDLAFRDTLEQVIKGSNDWVEVIRAPRPPSPDTIYRGILEEGPGTQGEGPRQHQWAVSDSRPAFDAADFLRFGKTVLGQVSNVTNGKGIEYVRRVLGPKGYAVEVLQVDDPKAMHLDATLLPLRQGLLVYNAERVTEKALRRHAVFQGWEMRAYPLVVQPRDWPPLFMTSAWIVLNVLSLDESRVVVEAGDVDFARWIESLGMRAIPCPFRHVQSIGGSFHCATVDLVREG